MAVAEAEAMAQVPIVEPPPTLTIKQLIEPSAIPSLRDNMQSIRVAVLVRLEVGAVAPEYREISIEAYPFDTVDDLKARIYLAMGADSRYLPRFLFLGIPATSSDLPRQQDTYKALDYLWYPPGVSSESQYIALQSPLAALINIQTRFRTSDGKFPAVSLVQRGRSLIEDIFPNLFNRPDDEPRILPVLHAFPMDILTRGFNRPLAEISETDWNGRFRPYFPGIINVAQTQITDQDTRLGQVLRTYMGRKDRALETLEEMLQLPKPRVTVEGVKQLRLTWPKKIPRFEGVENLFYRVRVTDRRSFMRLLPSQGVAVTKLHVTGGVPIPTVTDPKLLPQWAKEISPTADKDFLYIKYLHRGALGSEPAIYGTIRIFEEGSADLLLQPPKKIRKLELGYDFENFANILAETLVDFPAEIRPTNFNLAEISLLFSVRVQDEVSKFTRTKIMKRLALLQPFFQEIKPLPDEEPVVSLRYKAVSQFATEDRISAFLTQFATRLIIQGEGLTTELIRAAQAEFALSDDDARSAVTRWFENKGAYTVAVPEDGDFIEAYNPGVDLYIFGQHPSYSIHCYRIDSFHTFQRIYTLIGLLFFEDDDYFEAGPGPRVVLEQNQAEAIIEREELRQERIAAEMPAAVTAVVPPTTEAPTEVPQAQPIEPVPMPEVVEEGIGGEADEMPDFFMAEVFGEENVPQGNTANAEEVPPAGAAGAAAAPSNIRSGDVLDGPGSFSPDVARPAAASFVPRVVNEARTAGPALVPAAALPPSAAAPPVPAPAPHAPQKEGQRTINPKSWFLNKLQEVDSRLFEYTPKDGEDGYSRMCAANDDRMPNILTDMQYKRMRTIYENDDDIEFIEIPITGDEEPKKKVGYEQYFVLRFGSNPAKPNYFICPRFFCLLDEILVRPKDFASSRDRDGNPKPANTCPFCHGKLITTKDPVPGATVYKRKNKPMNENFHSYINFLKRTSNPEGFMLPCCFIEPRIDKTQTFRKLLRADNPAFAHFRTAPSIERRIELPLPTAVSAAPPEEQAELLAGDVEGVSDTISEGDAEAYSRGAVEYGVILQKVHKEYIKDPGKHPLDPGKIAVLPPAFERYFNQESSVLVKRTQVRQELEANSRGFLRMGVESSPGQKESLFAVLAPLLGRNTIQEVRERILEVCTPMVFISANFGNLVNEFYRPSDPDPEEITLKQFVNRYIDTDITSLNRQSLRRVYNSYQRFIEYVRSPARTKQLRHFQALLAEPGLFFPRGLQLVVLDWTKDSSSLSSEKGLPVVRCPSYGVSVDRQKKNDIAFIARDELGRFELFFYTDNKPARGGVSDVHINTERFKSDEIRTWPNIVRQRVAEYFDQCKSLYRSLYTPQEDVAKDIQTLVPLSSIETLVQRNFYGVVRDDYNHAIGVTFKLPKSKPSAGAMATQEESGEEDEDEDRESDLIIIPVVDDGSIIAQKHIHFGLEDCQPLASLPVLLSTYKTFVAPALSLYPGYRVRFVLRQRDDGFTMIQLANGIMIPCKPMTKKEADEIGLNSILERNKIEIREYQAIEGLTIESYVNKMLSSAKCGENPELKKRLSSQQLDELYQHFRLTFANWLSSPLAGPEVRRKIEVIIFGNLPEFEKRKRLEIILAGTMATWLQTDNEAWEGPEGFLRKDCRLIDNADQCTGVCRWRETAEEPRCRLHVPDRSPLGSILEVSTSELFIKRTLDELVRFPQRRQQLLKGKVGVLTEILEPVRYGDQYIIPENSLTWSELLRLDWAHFEPEKPEFYEEMSREAPKEDLATQLAEAMRALPAEMAEFLGELATPIKFMPQAEGDRVSLVPFLRLMGVTFKQLDMPPTIRIDNSLLRKLVSATKMSAGVVDLRGEVPVTAGAAAAAPLRPEPRVEFFRNLSDNFGNIYLFVVMPTGRIGMLVRNETQPYLEFADIPPRLKEKYDSAEGIMPVVAPVQRAVGGTYNRSKLRISRSRMNDN